MRVLLSWSSGKDSAWTLHTLRDEGTEVVGLLTTINEEVGRVSMQGVRRELLHAQAEAVSLPVWEVPLPSPCPNDEYERRMGKAIKRAMVEGITHVAFGDLFLAECAPIGRRCWRRPGSSHCSRSGVGRRAPTSWLHGCSAPAYAR